MRLVDIPAAFISLVDDNRDFYKSACGFGEPLASARELSGVTFCHYTLQSPEPLVIPDTREDVRYRHVPTVETLGVAAYVGIPLIVGGEIIGAFCAIDMQPRAWTKRDVDALTELAQIAITEITLRALSRKHERAKEDAEAANRSKSAFLAMMSHELRTPLNAIGGYAELIEIGVRGPVTSAQIQDLQKIQRSQRHLVGLISSILEYAKVDAGKTIYHFERVPVAEIVTLCESFTTPQRLEKKLSMKAAPSPGLFAWADREKMQQILLNLVSNAVKFTDPDGSIELRCEGDSERVFIHVTDTGRGIAGDELERVFQPFVQLDADLTRGSQGTGLGLAISRELARGMRGDVTAVSTLASGSTFTLVLPTPAV